MEIYPYIRNKVINNLGHGNLIDNKLGERGRYVGFGYSEIIKNLACVFLA